MYNVRTWVQTLVWSGKGVNMTIGTINGKNSKHRELKITFEHTEPLAKLLDYFSRSNKSNISQDTEVGFSSGSIMSFNLHYHVV